jgi:hypothetical protein
MLYLDTSLSPAQNKEDRPCRVEDYAQNGFANVVIPEVSTQSRDWPSLILECKLARRVSADVSLDWPDIALLNSHF